MGLSLSVLSTVDIIVPVAVLGPDPPDPTSDVVQFAFMARGTDPGNTDWVTGMWAGSVNSQYLAACLVGPVNGGKALPVGNYVIWMKITDNPEVPVLQVGALAITP